MMSRVLSLVVLVSLMLATQSNWSAKDDVELSNLLQNYYKARGGMRKVLQDDSPDDDTSADDTDTSADDVSADDVSADDDSATDASADDDTDSADDDDDSSTEESTDEESVSEESEDTSDEDSVDADDSDAVASADDASEDTDVSVDDDTNSADSADDAALNNRATAFGGEFGEHEAAQGSRTEAVEVSVAPSVLLNLWAAFLLFICVNSIFCIYAAKKNCFQPRLEDLSA